MFGEKRALETNSTPEVPSETKAEPGTTAPIPQAEAALSPAPPATTGALAMPQRAVSVACNWPVASVPSANAGMVDISRPLASIMALDQARAPTSSHAVPEASDMSDT